MLRTREEVSNFAAMGVTFGEIVAMDGGSGGTPPPPPPGPYPPPPPPPPGSPKQDD